MALRWDLKKDFIGTVKRWYIGKTGKKQWYKTNLYSGNALFIELYESKERFELSNYAADEIHLKRCLSDHIYERGYEVITLSSVNNLENNIKIAALFAKYHPEIKIIFTSKLRKSYHK